MEAITVLLIAVGLAMDAFAVSVSSGITIRNLRIDHALKIGIFFGSFQAIMPVIGWFAGTGMRDLVYGIDHWIAFLLLSFIGCRMIYGALWMDAEEREFDPLNIYVLLFLSFATSIDALAVGVSFAFLNVSILAPVLIIGLITFTLSFFGVYVGDRLGHFFEKKMEVAGGIILILIGLKILVESGI